MGPVRAALVSIWILNHSERIHARVIRDVRLQTFGWTSSGYIVYPIGQCHDHSVTTKKSPYTHAIAGVIKAERNRLGLSQTEMGDRAGIARITIARLEAAGRAPDTEQLEGIAKVIGRTPGWMLAQAEEQVARSGD